MISTILAALDGSVRAAGVFDAAAELARATGAHLILYRAVAVPPDFTPAGAGSTAPSFREFLQGEARAQLLSLSQRAPELRCELRVEVAVQPWRAIVDAAEAIGASLIVLGSHGYHGWDRVLGTTVGKVANVAQVNVLVVHERENHVAGAPPAGPVR